MISLHVILLFSESSKQGQKFNNLQYNKVGQLVEGAIAPLSDGPMFILIEWE